MQDHWDGQVCQRHRLVGCSRGHLLFPGEGINKHEEQTVQNAHVLEKKPESESH